MQEINVSETATMLNEQAESNRNQSWWTLCAQKESFSGESNLLKYVLISLVLLFLACTGAFIISASVLAYWSSTSPGPEVDGDTVAAAYAFKRKPPANMMRMRGRNGSNATSTLLLNSTNLTDVDDQENIQPFMAMQRLHDLYYNISE